MAITSIPTTRLSNPFMTQQILAQIASDQTNLFRVQSQLSSGRRVLAPSDDAPAAARAMALQALMERKNIVAQSYATNQTYLSSSESAIGSVATMLTEVRATAMSMVGNNVSPSERSAAVAEIDRAIQQLVETGNQKFRDRYLFAGSKTLDAPYVKTQDGIVYRGNEGELLAFSDIDRLFQSNVAGSQVFGGFSQPSGVATDLNPVLTWDTKLSDLRGGQGIRTGSISVSDGTATRTVNIAGAETIGDIARLLEANPPGNRVVTARVTSTGLEVSLNGGNLLIGEVAGGTTAAELGIKRTVPAGPGPLVGENLEPQLTLTTRLADVLGSRARAYVGGDGGRNDLIIEAVNSGSAYNNVTVKYVDDDWFQSTPGLTQGNEVAHYLTSPTAATSVLKFPGRPGLDNSIQLTAATPGAALNNVTTALSVRAVDGLGTQINYNSGTKTYSISVETGTDVATVLNDINTSGTEFTAALTPSGSGTYVLTAADNNPAAGSTYLTGSDAGTLVVRIDPTRTTAADVMAAVNAEGTFRAFLDPSEEGNTGLGTMQDSLTDSTAVGTTSGGTGTSLDLTSGLRIVNGSKTVTVDLSGADTVEDLLNIINGSGANVLASMNAARTGIEIRSRMSGAAFSIGENGGTTATQLGVRTTTGSTTLASLNHGDGVQFATDTEDFRITSRDGTSFGVSLSQGSSASVRVAGAGSNSGLVISRTARGTAGNQYSMQIVDSGVGGGDGVALVGNTLRFTVDVAAGFTAQEAQQLLANDPTLAAQFRATPDQSADDTNNGSGNLAATGVLNMTGGRGAASTIDDVLAIINNDPANLASSSPVVARLVSTGNGIELVNDGPPASGTLSVTRLGTSSAAEDLGLIGTSSTSATTTTIGNTATRTITFAGTNNDLVISARGSGATFNGVTIHFADDGILGNNSAVFNATTRTLTLDVDPATTTAQDVVDLLAGDPRFAASLTTTDGGVANTGGGTLGSLPADSTLAGGTADVLTGVDANPQGVQGIFSTLLMLRDAIANSDNAALEKAVAALDRDATSLSFSRAELGTQLAGLDVLSDRLAAENISLKGALSLEIEVDFVAAVSELAARQASFEASLKVSATLAQMTLLDYL
jgi:flagellar hook-associated protein 3 FlgL